MKKSIKIVKNLYPQSCESCSEMFLDFNEKYSATLGGQSGLKLLPRVLVVPHDGYAYSGYTANIAYRVANENASYKRVVILTPLDIEGIVINSSENYLSPCGELKSDITYSSLLGKKFSFEIDMFQDEKSLVQIPFIQYYFPSIEIVNIGYSRSDDLITIVEYLLEDSDNLLIFPTNLNSRSSENPHLDAHCINAITMLNMDKLVGCQATGEVGLEALIKVAKKREMKPQLLHYQMSSSVMNGGIESVGYMSIAL